jgi:hypothetical protein
MKHSKSTRIKHLAHVPVRALVAAGASRYLADKIKHHAKLSPEMLKKSMSVYRYVNYHQLRESGLNSSESKRYWNEPPAEIKYIVKKMRGYVETVVDLNHVENERKKGRPEAIRAVQVNMGKKKWEFQYIEDYIKERKSASKEEYDEYKAFMKRNGFIHFEEWRKGMQEERAYKKLFPGKRKK